VEHVARIRERKGAYTVLVGQFEGKRPPGRPSRRWKNNIKMYLQELECGAYTELIWLRTVTLGRLL
jgi:hypothetical protein